MANREAAQQQQELINNLPVEEPETPDAQIEQMVTQAYWQKSSKTLEDERNLRNRVDEGREARIQALNNLSQEQRQQYDAAMDILNDYRWPKWDKASSEYATDTANIFMEEAGDKLKTACGGSSECVLMAISNAVGSQYRTNCSYTANGSITCEQYNHSVNLDGSLSNTDAWGNPL